MTATDQLQHDLAELEVSGRDSAPESPDEIAERALNPGDRCRVYDTECVSPAKCSAEEACCAGEAGPAGAPPASATERPWGVRGDGGAELAPDELSRADPRPQHGRATGVSQGSTERLRASGAAGDARG